MIACGEALLPAFVASDPYGAGVAAVLTNVNDLAAMGAVPLAIVDTVVGSPELAREALRGMKDACGWYDVALAGGHLTLHDGAPALSAFGVGRAAAVLSTTNVAAGQSLVVAACTAGTMRTDFPFFRFLRGARRSAGRRRPRPRLRRRLGCLCRRQGRQHGRARRLAGDAARVEPARGDAGPGATPPPGRCVDAGVVDLLPGVRVLAVLLPRVARTSCLSAFHERGLEAAVVGVVDESGLVALRSGGRRATVIDLAVTGVTGLAR